jgi:hypothetical protein
MNSAESFVGPAVQVGDSFEVKQLRERLNRLERQVIVAMSAESLSCRYHGTGFDFLGSQFPGGPPRCDSCKAPWRRTQLLIAAGGVVPQ